jgi:transporter family-2 protein
MNGGAVALSLAAGIAGSIQIAVMSQLGNRVGIVSALAFATMLTAVCAAVVLVLVRHDLSGYADAARTPVWLWIGSLMGLLIVGSITFSGSRIGITATLGVLIAGQFAMSVAIDRWGLFGLDRIPLTLHRVVGLALLAGGAALCLKK